MSWLVSAARYEHPSGQRLTKDLLYPALEDVIRSTAVLSAQLPRPPAPPVWVRMPSVDLNKVVTFLDEPSSALQTTIEDIYARPRVHGPDLPLWCLVVFNDGVVAFVYDHTAGDGKSGPAFHSLLLAALPRVPNPPPAHSGIVEAPSGGAAPSLVPSMEEAIDTSVPFLMALRELARFFLPGLFDRRRNTAWTGHPTQNPRVLETRVRFSHVAPRDAGALVKLARAHGTTLTGIMHTLAIMVLSRLILASDADAAAKYTALPTGIPISLRRYTGVPPTGFCNHVSTHAAFHPFIFPSSSNPGTEEVSAETFPWATAAELTEALKRKAPNSAPAVGMLKFLFGNYDATLLGRLGKKRAAALELSNLGPFPKAAEGQKADGWQIRELLFSQADATLGAAIKINTVGSPDGGVGIGITWGKGAVDDELAEAFTVAFNEGLRTLAVSKEA